MVPFQRQMWVKLLLVAVLLSVVCSPVGANYGTEAKELTDRPDEDGKQAVKVAGEGNETSSDDSKIRTDEESLKKVDTQREELERKLGEIDRLSQKMHSKAQLLQRVKELKKRLSVRVKEENQVKQAENRAEENLRLAEQRKNATWDEKEQIAEERKKIEALLADMKNDMINVEMAHIKMDAQKKKADARERELEAERERLMKKVTSLVSQFRENGFHTWLEKHIDIFPPVIKETVLKTSSALEPIVRGVDGAAEFNEQLTNETTEAINQYLPAIKNSPFYTGLIFYIILLCPLVAAMWLVMRVKARLSLLTVEHYLIAINLYFGVLSVACAVMSILGRTDILIVFRHRSQSLAETFMLMHGFLFVLHLILHGMTAYVSGARKDFGQYICMSCVGLHFFMNAYKRTILNQDPNIGAPAYIIYSAIFLYTLHDRGVYVIEAAVKDRKADTSAFATYPDQSYVAQGPILSKEAAEKPVYFAGLPIYSATTQSSLNDAKTI